MKVIIIGGGQVGSYIASLLLEKGNAVTVLENKEKALRAQGLDRNWLEQRLTEHGVCSPSQVFLLTVDEAGSVCFVAREAV